MTRRFLATLVVAGLVAASCGSDDDAAPAIDAPADSAAPATDAPSDTAAPETDDVSTDDAEFPVTIEHKFGATTIDAEPERVVSIGYNEHDFLLALGVVPVALRDWYGEQPNSVWPWAQDELGDATPDVLPVTELNFEQIAALQPDLITGVWSGISDSDYELLSAIAPTVAQPDTYEDYGTPWQEQTLILGRATGREAEARAIVDELDAKFAAARDAHPEWIGQTASVAFVTEEGPGAYTSQDTRSRIMQDLGFVIPEINDSGGDGSFYLEMSPEDITPLDVDVLVWVAGAFEAIDGILNQLPTRPALTAVQEGREIFAGIELSGAFSHGSPLSLDYALEALVPEIEAAADGDPSTPVPSAVEVGAVDAPADDAATAAGAAWATVFDSTVAFADKAPHLADAEALEETIEAYAAAGDGFDGISLVPTDVVIDGEAAEVTYDVNFGANPAYTDQIGSIELVDGVWTVSRDEFCSFMASARVGCP
ncbi:iron-siderophore ABC transporter substrate-binding protein [Ilumatobacter coccineus]|uniref:Putative iron siderophore ABC transporter iron siderophore-binding protein n=1 Tax=Ilumatobacter coccineus (strain NBRC 103263 / KCTC 29153 / YM16-304) TaxID=1313172 RepID=A0A6C7E9V6_ILUCY|nr:iron-siderophore ABC transporter substrate-binding protein [Ilumatobacter coccineus]BAN04444.1 putative iron siderophore ABC transporter iron siderophore-binding protein [Ilumatobacter coccineus YM16-304]